MSTARYPAELQGRLQEILAGLAAQATPPTFPDLSVADLTKLKNDLAAAEERARAAEAAAEMERDKRNTVGVQANAAYVKMAGYLRAYYKGQPALLAQFGLEPKKTGKKAAAG